MSLRGVFGSSTTLFAIFAANISKSSVHPHVEHHHHHSKKEQNSSRNHHNSHQFQIQPPKSRQPAFSRYNQKIGDKLRKSKSKNSTPSKRK
ncbi:17383_t:CDS:2 [Funneliformis caledonium]|uniref:17383_t:CDS:1 n=1 Tax=Funneliformis caledonium TaxID=1117310 RepID=A0A9N9DMI1_9GLOM|nr:17383_t:CDS:2 [Funneliformis caledonium]